MNILKGVAVAALASTHSGMVAQNVRVALIKMPYVGERNTAERSGGPDYLEQGGIGTLYGPAGIVVLSGDDEKAYGPWNRLALANGNLAKLVAEARRSGAMPVGLLANCSALPGMLAGLQHSGPNGRPLRVGLVLRN